jgi:hypothetical protein
MHYRNMLIGKGTNEIYNLMWRRRRSCCYDNPTIGWLQDMVLFRGDSLESTMTQGVFNNFTRQFVPMLGIDKSPWLLFVAKVLRR